MTASTTETSVSEARAAPALRLTGIEKHFGSVVANHGVSLTVEPGEIHALLGENGAGKTTLVNIVFGLVAADAGTIEIDGVKTEIGGPRQALELGVGMVHQHFKLVPDMTVAENLALSRGRAGLGPVRLAEVREEVRRLSRRYGFDVDPDAVIEELSVGARQRVEIVKLLLRGARILILDEPTAVLTPQEWARLAEILQSLAAEGRAIVFITHKLDEVFAVARRCTVLRDGEVVAVTNIAETTREELARLMVGRDVNLQVRRDRRETGAPVLEVRGLCLQDQGRDLLRDIELTVGEREILGIAGVDGNGQRELIETIVGTTKPTSGEVRIDGRPIGGTGSLGFLAAGGGVIPEDRHRSGLALGLPVLDNLVAKEIDRPPLARHGILDRSAMRKRAAELIESYDIRARDTAIAAAQLSGGNQQKIVVARELGRGPRVLIAAQPTRGLDVGAMEFVYEQLVDFASRGGAVLLISTELEEILALSDRIAVIAGGQINRILDASEANPELLGLLMAGERVPNAPERR